MSAMAGGKATMDEYVNAALGGQSGENSGGATPQSPAGDSSFQKELDSAEPGEQGSNQSKIAAEPSGSGSDANKDERRSERGGADGRLRDLAKPASFTRGPSAEARAARITAQRETEERLRRDYDRQISELGGLNPYTNRPYESFSEFQSAMKRRKAEDQAERSRKENRPISEIIEEDDAKELLRRQRRESAERTEQAKSSAQRDAFLMADAQAFVQAFPDIDLGALESDARFQRFAKGRLYNEPLAEIYGDYLDFVGEAEAAAGLKAQRQEGKEKRGTGSGGGDGGSTQLTKRQQNELDEYNRRFPQKKMTPKEFLSWS